MSISKTEKEFLIRVLVDLKKAIGDLGALGVSLKETGDEGEQSGKKLQTLTDRLEPAAARAKKLKQEITLLNRAQKDGSITSKRHAELVGKLKKEYKNTEKAIRATNKAVQFATRAVAAYIGIRTLTRLISEADAWHQLQGRIKNATKETGDYVKVSRELYRVSQENGAALRDTVDVFQRLAFARKDLDATNDQMIELTDLVQKLGVISGATKSQLSAGLLQFGQGLGEGVFRAQEFNSQLENMPAVVNAMADGLGKSKAELRKMVIEGQLFSRLVLDAILSQSEDINKQFKEMPVSVTRTSTSLGDSFTRLTAALDTAAEGTGKIARAMQFMIKIFDAAADRLNETELDTLMRKRAEAMVYYQQLLAMGTVENGAVMQRQMQKIHDLDQQIIAANQTLIKQQDLMKSQRGDVKTIDPKEQKRKEAVDKLIGSLEKQADKEGKTKAAIFMARLENAKATDAEKNRAQVILDGMEATRKAQDLQKQGKAVYESTRTAAERYATEVEKINNLLSKGAIDEDTHSRAMKQATEDMEKFVEKGEEGMKRLKAATDNWTMSFASGIADLAVDGEADFDKMAKAIIKDLIRIYVYQQLVGMAGAGVPAGGAGAPPAPATGSFATAHTGGIAGSLTGRSNVSPAVFAGAKRYHRGGFAGLSSKEVPIIVERGEEILTRDDPRHALNQGQGGSVKVVIENKGADKQVTHSSAQFDGRDMVVSIFVDDINRGGPIDKALESTGRPRKIS